MNDEELNELYKRVNELIKSQRTTKANINNSERILIEVANNILTFYDLMDNKKRLNDILGKIGNELIRKHKNEILKNNKNNKPINKTMDLLYKIHAKTLLETDQRPDLPEFFSKDYFRDVLVNGYKTDVDNYIFDEKIINFLEKLGESDFSVEKPEEYRSIIDAIVIDQLRNNTKVQGDKRVSENKTIINILIQYARSLSANKSNLEVRSIIDLMEENFSDYIDSLPENDRNFILERINKYGAFKAQALSKDITQYTSYADFINGINQVMVQQDPNAPHIPVPRVIVNSGSKTDNVMSDDRKFKAIQDAITYLRQKYNPNITVKEILVGYQPPFKGYILFPIEKVNYALDMKNRRDNDVNCDNFVISEIFGNTQGAALYIMTKNKSDYVFSMTNPANPGKNNGPSTRLGARFSGNGILSVRHDTGPQYETTLIERLDALIQNPTLSSRTYKKPKKNKSKTTITRAKSGIKAASAKQNKTSIFYNLGIDMAELNNAPSDMNSLEEYVSETRKDMMFKYGNDPKKVPEVKLLDYCLKEIFIKGKDSVTIANELASQYGIDPTQMIIYMKAKTIGVASLDQEYVKDSLRVMYKKETEKLKNARKGIKITIEEKEEELNSLRDRMSKIKDMFTWEK